MFEVIIYPSGRADRLAAIAIGYEAYEGNLKRLSKAVKNPDLERNLALKYVKNSPIIVQPLEKT